MWTNRGASDAESNPFGPCLLGLIDWRDLFTNRSLVMPRSKVDAVSPFYGFGRLFKEVFRG